MDYISRTLAKGLDVLLLLADKDGLSLAEISNKTGISKTTAFRLLYTLCEYELICKSDNKYYMNCAYNLLQPDNKILDWSVIPYIKPLVEEFNLSAYIGIPTGEYITYSQIIPRKDHPEDYAILGEKRPLNTNAMGKCALACLEIDELLNLLRKIHLKKNTPSSITDMNAFINSLQIIHDQGYAIDDEETQEGKRCVGVPIIVKNKCIATLGMSGTTNELKRSMIKNLAYKMKATSSIISNRLF
ncbi:IclR family transcriptional regulator [Ligilactobacillus aviarius]|uniref:IclR family transcriptional regulator n=1 Tax=Ligilactobacillus aviarius TaxID=1606 RepID=A0A179CKH0_9LACO|nr:IclR family transcriptional regulator C-terminal domain-containing protein [Ligilactobacillus aviarius]OAP97932.1 hypothetical protein A3O08_00820 [Ligilactobacillus aviarius]OAP98060.1 hypothetical protein A3O09_00440 [Ligilactobacillus aviarius]OAP98541.1 hypothetical protein A3O07_06035 [Ligilactobacillus aviarius]OAQ03204.1 hypothetical protein A3O10_06375 [Ligilactobacillus aviarius]OAQ03253.1 hypothetical protein A3O11_07000 [Ligilactobacillus aviarius]